jgi:mitochondrial fission protein ELM1
MPRYWRDPGDDTVHLSRPGCPIDEFDVIVIPVAQWRRLVEFFNGWVPTCGCDGHCGACDEDSEIKAIINSVEAPE